MSFGPLHDVPNPDFDELTLIVLGSNSDWGETPIEDALYAHILQKFNRHSPQLFTLENLDPDNKAWDNMGQYHLYVQLLRTHGDRFSEPVGWLRYYSTLRVHLIMKRLNMGQIADEMSAAASEVERILIEYSPHWIAGIDFFDNIDIIPIDEPTDNPGHPFNNTWHIAVDANAFYTKGTDFQIEQNPYDPTQHAAGSLTYI